MQSVLRYQRAFTHVRLTRSKPSWIELDWLDERSDKDSCWMAASVTCNGESYTGLSPAIKKGEGRHGVLRAVLATLNALEVFAQHQITFELVDIGQARSGGQQSIFIRVRIKEQDRSEEIFGSARVDGDFAEAAARAALDAANVYIDAQLTHA
jgi:hypothetical protein